MAHLLLLFLISIAARAEEISSPDAVEPGTESKSAILRDQDEAYLQRHYPFYFAYNAGTSKLQLSFKSPVIKGTPLYFGYTQLMFWALHDDSKPFRDLTYNPELFYRQKVKWSPVKSLDFGLWNHNSNGKQGDDSRSFDKFYLRANMEKEFKRWIFNLSLQLSHHFDIEDGNHDIRRFISPYSLNFSWIQLYDAWIDKSELAVQIIPGGEKLSEFHNGGYQLSWSFRLGGINVVPAFYLQYYRGYAETLLNYDSRVEVFRGGFIF